MITSNNSLLFITETCGKTARCFCTSTAHQIVISRHVYYRQRTIYLTYLIDDQELLYFLFLLYSFVSLFCHIIISLSNMNIVRNGKVKGTEMQFCEPSSLILNFFFYL